jgi:predicted PurR-regulated permease PerM
VQNESKMLPETNDLRANSAHYLWLTLVAVIVGLLIYWLGPILAPFLTAAILAYICDPLVDRLEARKVPRTLATSLVLLLLITLLVLLVLIILPVFYREISLLIERLPDLVTHLKNTVQPWLKKQFDIELQLDVNVIRQALTENWQKAGGLAGKLFASVTIGGLAVVGFFVNLILVPVVTFYLLRDWDKFIAQIDALIPRRWYERVTGIVREIDSVLAEFLRGQLSVMFIMAIYYSAGLAIAGLQFALPIGIIAGVLVFVPFVGSITGLVLSLLAAATQFTTLGAFAGVIVVFVIGQLIEGYVVTPRFVGDRIGLHPVAVIFALLAFGELFGFVGVLLALPLAAMVLVGLRNVRKEYIASNVYHS